MVETFCHLNLSISTVLDYQNKIKRQRIRNHVYTICIVASYIYFPFVSYFYYCICIWIYYIYYIFLLLLLIKVLSRVLELLHFFLITFPDRLDWLTCTALLTYKIVYSNNIRLIFKQKSFCYVNNYNSNITTTSTQFCLW